MTTDTASFAEEWIAAWNSHDLDRILAHYHPQIRFSSPIIQQLGVNTAGYLEGKDALASYFEKGLAAYPHLHFRLRQVLVGSEGLVLYYDGASGNQVAEQMNVDETGLIREVKVFYSR